MPPGIFSSVTHSPLIGLKQPTDGPIFSNGEESLWRIGQPTANLLRKQMMPGKHSSNF